MLNKVFVRCFLPKRTYGGTLPGGCGKANDTIDSVQFVCVVFYLGIERTSFTNRLCLCYSISKNTIKDEVELSYKIVFSVGIVHDW